MVVVPGMELVLSVYAAELQIRSSNL